MSRIAFHVPSGSLPTEKSPGGVTMFVAAADFFACTICNEPSVFLLSCVGVAWAFMLVICIF